MNRSVVWTSLAIERLEEAESYIARDKPGAAVRWALGLLEAVECLADFPESGRVVPETKRREIRELTFGAYRVIYRIESRRVLILTIRHSRRRFDPKEAR